VEEKRSAQWLLNGHRRRRTGSAYAASTSAAYPGSSSALADSRMACERRDLADVTQSHPVVPRLRDLGDLRQSLGAAEQRPAMRQRALGPGRIHGLVEVVGTCHQRWFTPPSGTSRLSRKNWKRRP
jgi:hypothetical protein